MLPPIFASTRSQPITRLAGVGMMFCLLILPAEARPIAVNPVANPVAGTATSPDAWTAATSLRQQLEDSPPEQRTRDRFETVLNAFRAIYHQNPTASKAPAAVAAVADLLAEQGRILHDQRSSHAAIGQYEFLRQQYPDSPQIDNTLLIEGEICRQDLKDTACAIEKFSAVMATQPGSSFAEQAEIERKELTEENTVPAAQPPQKVSAKAAAVNPAPAPPTASASARQAAQSKTVAMQPQPVAQLPTAAAPPAELQTTSLPAMSANLPSSQSGKAVTITGMRHWSNPTSTRIAIDLGGKVEYEAARVTNPDRIFFDLHGAKLAPGLNGRQVEVIDDGYLKRIRAAQFRSDVTRVVLDVTDVSEYSAFLLPNPWRLIIDVHSDKPHALQSTATAPPPSSVKPGAPVRSDTPAQGDPVVADVARLSSEPSKVRATEGPTSGPVSARVPSRELTSATNQPSSAANRPDSSADPADSASSLPSSSLSSLQSSAKQPTGQKKNHNKRSNAPDDTAQASLAPPPPLPHAADPDSGGQRSLVRALGLKVGRIVIDAGHGGHDSGTLGPGGIEEKDVVLDVALRTGKLLHQRLGAEIVYTRSDDTFVPLETRTAIANKAQADLFLSIHGNSSPEPGARGVETYYLNFTSDPNALDVAARENAVSAASVHQLSDLVRKIALQDKIDESREFATDVDSGLFAGLKTGNPGLRDRGVKKAPFVVLIGAQMPSILAEISFLTNPDDAEELSEPAYRQRIAESLASGVEHYLRGLSGTNPSDQLTPPAPAQKSKSQAKSPAAMTSADSSGQ